MNWAWIVLKWCGNRDEYWLLVTTCACDTVEGWTVLTSRENLHIRHTAMWYDISDDTQSCDISVRLIILSEGRHELNLLCTLYSYEYTSKIKTSIFLYFNRQNTVGFIIFESCWLTSKSTPTCVQDSVYFTSNVTAVTEARSASCGLVLHAQHIFANSFNFLVTWGLPVTIFYFTCIFYVHGIALYAWTYGLFAGTWRPWWVLLQHCITLRLFFLSRPPLLS